MFACQEGDLCQNEIYHYGDIVGGETYPVMTAARWAMVNEYNTTAPATRAAMKAELKHAYCSSRKLSADRMGC